MSESLAPGDLLALFLRDRRMTQTALASTLGRPAQMVSEIVTGKKRVTATTAAQLQRVFGLPAFIWLGLQAHTDLAALVRDTQRCLIHLEPDVANCRGCAADRKAVS